MKITFLLLAILIGCTKQDNSIVKAQEKVLNPHTILHVLALNAGKGKGHPFVITLSENYLTDTSVAGKIVRQLSYMNQQANHNATYPSAIYPNDTFEVTGQGNIWELWISETQQQINNGSPEWIESILDAGYTHHNQVMSNVRAALKIVYPNL